MTPTPPAVPTPTGLPKNKPRRYLCFTCPAHPTFATLDAFKAHVTNGHHDPV
jgi:hypothetical protein